MRLAAITTALVACAGARAPTCDSEVSHPPAPAATADNVLILLLDDVGVDKVGAWGLHPNPPRTPTLDSLVVQGVRFDRAYAEPSCSPTRAALLTGRHPTRTGIGWWLDPRQEHWSLADEEVTLPELLRPVGYASGLAGKWHLSAFDGHGAERDPQRQGFDHFRGILGNPTMAVDSDGASRGYDHWERVDDGVLSWDDRYLTTVQVDDALALARSLPEPWLVVASFSAAHSPWSDPPPAELTTGGAPKTVADEYAAVLEALDTEIARLLDGLGDRSDRTTVFTLGDNGTPGEVVTAPWSSRAAKNTVTEGGVRVPLIVTGAAVSRPGSRSDALVHVADVFATVADLAGVDLRVHDGPVVDGRSFLSSIRDPDDRGARRCLMVEQFYPNGPDPEPGTRAVVDRDRKVVRRDGMDTVFDVFPDPSLEASSAGRVDHLVEQLDRYEDALR